MFFSYYNAGKRSVVVDLERDRASLERLLDAADVLLVTGRPSELRSLDLDPAVQSARRPRLVVAAISPFGQDGPRAEWKSSDTVAQALGGMAFVNGHPGEPPLRSFGLQAYHLASLHAATGVMLALLDRERSGCGQVVDVSLQESVVSGLEHVTARFFDSGEIERRRGTLHWGGAFRVGRCRDGLVLASSAGDWTALVEWLKADGKAGDLVEPAWEDFTYRREHAEHFFDVIDRWLPEHSVAEIVEGAQLRRLPFAPVLPIDALPGHPQLAARGFFVPRRAPRIGEHSGSLSRMGEGEGEGDETLRVLSRSVEDRLNPPHPSPLPSGRGNRRGRGESNENARSVLHGIRVLDFTWVVAGPVATRVLADHGADVIKVERPDARTEGRGRGGLGGALNRGKRSIVLDLACPEGIAVARQLVERCDVVIDNFSPRVMENWGLDPASLREINPNVIAVGMSGFGATGPMRDHVSYGPTLQAITGHTWHMRHPGGEPAGWGFSFSDMASGYAAAFAVLIALWQRRRTGEGQAIDISQLEALAALCGPALLAAYGDIEAVPPLGNRSQERAAAPHGIYRCASEPGGEERWCAICVFTEVEWERLVRAMGNPAWARAEHFRKLTDRMARQAELDACIEEWTRPHVAEEVAEILQAAGVAAGIVANAEDLCVRDPQLAARGWFAAIRTPEGDAVTMDGPTVRLSSTPGRVRAAGPRPGEHTDEVLRELL